MTYFISGHRDVTWEEFTKWYAPTISALYMRDPDAKWIVAECKGVDSMAQDFLVALGVLPSLVTVYHMCDKPRYLASNDFQCKGGYDSDDERDEAMTRDSNIDIAYIRAGKENSGTAQNILRRWTR